MAELLSRLDLYNIARRYVLTRARKIDPEQVDVEGSDINIICGVSSHMAAAVVAQFADRLGAHMLGSARLDDLDRWLLDHYELPRKGAAAAVVPVRFYRATSAGGAGTIPAGTLLEALTGPQYVTKLDVSFGGSDLAVSVDARATQAGKEYQVGANQIRRIVSLPGGATIFDSTISVNNDVKAAGGEPREGDEDYRYRGRAYWRSVAKATLSAIEFGALEVQGIASAQAVEAVTQSAMPARVVNLFAADSSGVSNTALGRTVSSNLDDWRAAGIAVLVSNSTPQMVDVVLALAFSSTVDSLTLTNTIRTAVVGYINSLGVNATLTRAALYSVLQRYASRGLVVADSSVVTPAGNVVPTSGYTLRTTLERVTAQ